MAISPRQPREDSLLDPRYVKALQHEGFGNFSYICVNDECGAYASKCYIDGHTTWRCKICNPEFFLLMRGKTRQARPCLSCGRLFPSEGIQNRRCDRCKSNEKEWL